MRKNLESPDNKEVFQSIICLTPKVYEFFYIIYGSFFLPSMHKTPLDCKLVWKTLSFLHTSILNWSDDSHFTLDSKIFDRCILGFSYNPNIWLKDVGIKSDVDTTLWLTDLFLVKSIAVVSWSFYLFFFLSFYLFMLLNYQIWFIMVLTCDLTTFLWPNNKKKVKYLC